MQVDFLKKNESLGISYLKFTLFTRYSEILNVFRNTKCIALCPFLENQYHHALCYIYNKHYLSIYEGIIEKLLWMIS